jgi:hypothetical protein
MLVARAQVRHVNVTLDMCRERALAQESVDSHACCPRSTGVGASSSMGESYVIFFLVRVAPTPRLPMTARVRRAQRLQTETS